jgi:hypothetical protein
LSKMRKLSKVVTIYDGELVLEQLCVTVEWKCRDWEFELGSCLPEKDPVTPLWLYLAFLWFLLHILSFLWFLLHTSPFSTIPIAICERFGLPQRVLIEGIYGTSATALPAGESLEMLIMGFVSYMGAGLQQASFWMKPCNLNFWGIWGQKWCLKAQNPVR